MMHSSLVSRFLRASVFAGIAGIVGMTACVQDQETLIVERAVWYDDSCTMNASSNVGLAEMTADVYFTGSSIGLGVVVTNQAIQNPQSNTGLDDSEIQLLSADVTLSFSGGALSTSSFNYPVPTNSLGSGDSQPVLIQIPTDIVDSMRATMAGQPDSIELLEIEIVVLARKASAASQDGKLGSIETRSFVFPMQICYGCLTSCVDAQSCGGEGDELICPAQDAWAGGCGYAQGGGVVAPECAEAS